MSFLGCGPSNAEKNLQSSSSNFATQLQSNYSQLFGQQQGVMSAINKSISPTLAAGPSQNGFSPQENANLTTQAINSSGAASRAAQQSIANYGAGQGSGGSSGLTSGITKQLQASAASQAAGNLTNQTTQIGLANEAQGNANYRTALGASEALAQGYSPNASASGAIGENQASFQQADTIQQQQQQEAQAIAGAVGSIGMAAFTGGASLAASPAGASQPGAFASGFAGSLFGGGSNG